nr:RES family NAD+ phosphorylase [Microbulbifer elongatus]
MYELPSEVASQREEWRSFKKELKHGNRYFPQYEEYRGLFSRRGDDYGIFGDLISQLQKKYYKGDQFYRTRLSEDELLSAEEMGRPPAIRTSNGRANPAGISYLYVSEDQDTAVKEVRPSIGGTVFISEILVREDFRVIDLTSPKVMASVLKFEGERMVPALKYLNLLESFSSDLANPVIPEKSHLEYVPTQFVCEFLKNIADFNGIRYASSYGSHANLVLFGDEKLEIIEPGKHIVTGASVEYALNT